MVEPDMNMLTHKELSLYCLFFLYRDIRIYHWTRYEGGDTVPHLGCAPAWVAWAWQVFMYRLADRWR